MKKVALLVIFLFVLPINIRAYETSASSAILMDIDSGKIIYSKNIHNKRSIASISKIMTAIVAIESKKLDDVVTIGDEISDATGSGIYIKQGEHIKLRDLLYGLMLRSGNDAALSIANYVGGDVNEFVNLMNKKAMELGMKNSEFNNPSGLDQKKGNYSTAYDMAILTSYAMKNDEYRKITSTKHYKIDTDMNYYSWTNKNKLLFSYQYITGGKTGYTDIARRTLVTTASKDNLNLVVVTLNDGNDFIDHKKLYEEAYNEYKNYQIIKEGNISVPGENYYNNSILYINESINYPCNNENVEVKIKYKLDKKRFYKTNDEVGKIEVYVGDALIKELPIYVKKNEEQTKNTWLKFKDWVTNLW